MTDTRSLTSGELVSARGIFGSAITFERVLVHRGKYIFFQPSHKAMTPNGEIYFPEAVYKPDFSQNVPDMSWMIHELTHVWQYQTGVDVRLAAPFSTNYEYGKLDATVKFSEFNIEQQAAIVTDYFLKTNGYTAQYGTGSLDDYKAVIPFTS